MGKLLALAIRERKRAPMKALDFAYISKSSGLDNDFRGKLGDRQVTVLSKKAWDAACDELGCALAWHIRRSNILVDDIELYEAVGKTIKIANVELLITCETNPCARMEESYKGLFAALAKDWRGGVCCRVISEGEIKIGDEVTIDE